MHEHDHNATDAALGFRHNSGIDHVKQQVIIVAKRDSRRWDESESRV
ncbi:MAG: hypothetical protein R3C26_19520 [Calditrichia bacterium]